VAANCRLPATAEPVPRIAEPAPAPPEPIAPAPLPEAPPAPSTTPKATESKATDLVRTVKRTAAKVEQKMAQKQRMEEANAADKARKEAAAAKKIMTKEQYDKLYGKQATRPAKPRDQDSRVDAEASPVACPRFHFQQGRRRWRQSPVARGGQSHGGLFFFRS